jgi:hypothetical protein
MPSPLVFEDLRHLQATLLTKFAEVHNYASSWGKDFVFKQITELPAAYRSFTFDPNDLSLENMIQLGFRKWDESGLQLIPLWLFPYIKAGSCVRSISGEELKFSANLDNDHRFGMLAFGVIPGGQKPATKEPVKASEEDYDKAAESL